MKSLGKAVIAASLAAGVATAPAVAQDFPDRPLTMIIPLGAGGSHDLIARVITSVLPSHLGQPVVVQLMPGAGGQTGTAAAAAAQPDGYTMIFTHNFIDQVAQHVTTLPYDPNADFVTIGRINSALPSLTVRADSPFETYAELAEYGRANPGELRFGHSGNWGATMVPGLAVFAQEDIDVSLIPYQGGGPTFQALLAGDVDFTFQFPSNLAGRDDVRPLLTVGEESIFDGVPSTGELGLDLATSVGQMHRPVLVPSGVPEDRLEVLRAAFVALTEDATFRTLMQRLDEEIAWIDGPAYDEMRRAQSESFRQLVEGFQ